MESRTRWALTLGVPAIATLFVGIISLGPDEVWNRVQWPWAGYPPPELVSIKPDPEGPAGSYIATLRNPSWKAVTITGYAASTSVGLASSSNVSAINAVDDGGITIMQSKEPSPSDCTGLRKVDLPRPLKIEPDGVRGIQIRPWTKACWFEVRFHSDNGDTTLSSVFDELDVKEITDLKNRLDRHRDAAKQTCPDGSVIPVKDSCPPPPPPPPLAPAQSD